jgi:UDP-GlcNAc:undecaprenyl-phosphate GlcNAc-1-phosphate transferase
MTIQFSENGSFSVAVLLHGLIGFGITLALTPLVIGWIAPRVSLRRELHQTHTISIPRLGGVALAATFVLAIVASLFWLPNATMPVPMRLATAGTALAMFGLGLWDDISPLGARKKLFVQILIALAAFALGLKIESFKNPVTGYIYLFNPWFSVVTTVFWFVAMTNLINLIDGIDGLAGGVSLMLMCLLAYVAFGAHPFLCCVAVAMAGALCGFLRFNFPPARIYLGDGGAYFIGFLIGALSLQNSNKGAIAAALIAPVFALALPILDVSFSIVRRGFKGLPIFRPDRRHIHHRLLQSGLSGRRAVLVLYGVSLVFLAIAFAAFLSDGRLTPILFGCVFLIVLVSLPSFGMIKNWLTIGTAFGNSLEARKDIQYALLIRNWIQMEADRSGSLNELWGDFTYMARKLGFKRVSLRFEDNVCLWEDQQTASIAKEQHASHHLQVRHHTVVLELSAPLDRMDNKKFQLLSELAAEAWLNATRRWFQRHETTFELPGLPRPSAPAGVPTEAFAAGALQ